MAQERSNKQASADGDSDTEGCTDSTASPNSERATVEVTIQQRRPPRQTKLRR